jgi:sulfofructose kinase
MRGGASPGDAARSGDPADRPRRVICLGAAAIGHDFAVDAIPARPIKVQATAYRETCAGLAARAAVAIAGLGHAARLLARIGDDANGARLGDRLARAGVDIAALRRCPGARTASVATIADPAGARLIASFPGAGLDEDPGWLALDPLAPADAVLVDGHWPAGARALLRAARALGVPGILATDAEPATPDPGLASLADHAIAAPRSAADGVFLGAYALAIARGRTPAQARRHADAAPTDATGSAP